MARPPGSPVSWSLESEELEEDPELEELEEEDFLGRGALGREKAEV